MEMPEGYKKLAEKENLSEELELFKQLIIFCEHVAYSSDENMFNRRIEAWEFLLKFKEWK